MLRALKSCDVGGFWERDSHYTVSDINFNAD